MRAIVAALLITFAWQLSTGPAHAADLRFFDDATLRAVHFFDAKEGWAVGDEGAIWHTIDGGENWDRQKTGLRASLRSVVFLSPHVGWVAGRDELPHGRGSVGVLLFTRDGGETWQRLLTNALPGLNQVKFLDAKAGFVFGDGSEQFATGVFRTGDGGRTWEPVPGPRAPSWFAGDFQDAKTGVLAGAWGHLATLRNDALTIPDDVDPLGGRTLRGLALLPKRAVAVGQGGLILTSVSGGKRWGFADLKLPTDILACLDWNAIHSVGPQAWVVGRPGSAVLHTADSGGSWQILRTGQPLPLHGVFFLDEKRGWAVGELGTILATSDGGQTWKTQRQGGKRAAACLVHAQPDDVPLDTIAQLGADEGYLLSALRVLAPDPASAAPGRALDAQRFAAAVRQAGAASGEMLWQFALPQHLAQADEKQLLAFWNQAQDNQAGRELLRHLVLALRIWRPEVVLTGQPSAKNPAAALVAEALLEAVKLADDAKAFPEQVGQLGLQTWKVKKLYYQWDKNYAQIDQDNHAFKARLEASLHDFAAAPASLLAEAPRPLPSLRFYRLIHAAGDGGDRQKHMMLGLAMAAGDTRRQLPEPPKEDPDLQKAQRAVRDLGVLAANLDDPNKTLAQVAPSLAKLPDDQAARAAFAIANQYARGGQWNLARETFILMVDRYPSHPLAVDAYRWLIRHISSSEARRRHELGQFLMVTNASYNPKLDPEPKEGKIQKVKGSEVVSDARLTFLANKDETRQWHKGSLEIGQRLAAFGPLFASDPAIQFCLQSSRRQLGEFAAAQDWYAKYRTHGPKGPYSEAAAAELWLTNRALPPPRRIALSRFTAQKPFLDGNLEDACWQSQKPMVLENTVGDTAKEHPTLAWLAHDQEYLYLAFRCKHPKGRLIPPVKNRVRDDFLDSYDRVGILLDLDRDYSTYFHLQVDQRGCVREDCWGDLTWNPRWFVAVKSNEDAWTIEAAIPLNELTADRISPSTAWAVNIVRTLPGRGVQSWSLPADVYPRPEGMSLLLFKQDPNRPVRPEPMPKAP